MFIFLNYRTNIDLNIASFKFNLPKQILVPRKWNDSIMFLTKFSNFSPSLSWLMTMLWKFTILISGHSHFCDHFNLWINGNYHLKPLTKLFKVFNFIPISFSATYYSASQKPCNLLLLILKTTTRPNWWCWPEWQSSCGLRGRKHRRSHISGGCHCRRAQNNEPHLWNFLFWYN